LPGAAPPAPPARGAGGPWALPLPYNLNCMTYCGYSQIHVRGYDVSDRKADIMAPDGTTLRRIRIDSDLWERLDEAAKQADPDTNRSVLVRKFMRWYVGDIDEMPQRPEPKREGR